MNDMTEIKVGSPIVLRTMDDLVKFSKLLAASELVPKDFIGKDANIFVAIQWGLEIGLQPMQALQSIAVINGRPSLWGDAGLALVYGSGLVESFEEEISAESATCRTKRKGNPKETVRTFAKDDAVRADLWGKGTYAKYPKRMLQMRARWWALRDAYTDVLRGVAGAEELIDVEIDVTPPGAPVVEQPRAKSQVKDAELVDAGKSAPAEPAKPAAAETPKPAKPLLAGQLAIINAKLRNAALTEMDLVSKFGPVQELRFEQFEEVQAWITERAAKIAG